jgi:hypothetical protein
MWMLGVGKWLAGLVKGAISWIYHSFLPLRLAVGAFVLFIAVAIVAELQPGT